MKNCDFPGFLQMLLNILYLHNYMLYIAYNYIIIYRTGPMTQNRKSGLEVKKLDFDQKNANIIYFLISFFGPAVFCKCLYLFYTCIICGIRPIR